LCEKDLILKEVFKRYRNSDGSRIDLDDDNIADAVNVNMVGRALLGWFRPENEAQRSVVEALLNPPKPKAKKKRGIKQGTVAVAA